MVSPLKRRPAAPSGTEIWAVGGLEDLAVVRAQLGAAGQLVEVGAPVRLVGADAGRFSQYLRLTVNTSS